MQSGNWLSFLSLNYVVQQVKEGEELGSEMIQCPCDFT